MHQAQSYIQSRVLQAVKGVTPDQIPLNAAHAAGIRNSLRADALGYCYSGAVSIADGIRGIDTRFFTWATVKLYYATFYLTRALLALRGVSIFYNGRTPFRWIATAGQLAKKLKGNTHNVVLDEFQVLKYFPTFLGQQIATDEPLQWLRLRREAANYGSPRFDEPGAPDHFNLIAALGVRKATEAYLSDASLLYVFDKDHAMLAYPIELLKHTIGEIRATSAAADLSEGDRGFLATLCKDSKGPIPGMRRLLLP